MLNILLDQLKTRFVNVLQGAPPGRITQLGVSSCLAVLLHLAVSNRARRIMAFTLEASTLAGAVSAFAGSLTLLAAKSNLDGSQNVSDSSVLMQVWRACKDSLRGTKHWQGVIAALALIYFARRRRRIASGGHPQSSLHQF
jgi:hypothetical protein